MDRFRGISEFVAAVDAKSFVAAGRRLGMTASGVSKAVGRLEDRLGAYLVNRTTRGLRLTESGTAFYERCRHLLVDLDETERLISQHSNVPAGKLRIHLPAGFGRLVVLPALPRFVEQYSSLAIDITLRNGVVDMLEEGVDATVRVGAVAGANVIAHCVGSSHFITCAAPSYLQRAGVPKKPEDLLQHNCLRYIARHTGRPRDWSFSQNGKSIRLPVSGNMILNDGLLEAATGGAGIVQLWDYAAAEAIGKGLLQPVLVEWNPEAQPVCVVYPASNRASTKVKAFVDFLSQLFPFSPRRSSKPLRAQKGDRHTRSPTR